MTNWGHNDSIIDVKEWDEAFGSFAGKGGLVAVDVTVKGVGRRMLRDSCYRPQSVLRADREIAVLLWQNGLTNSLGYGVDVSPLRNL